MDMDGCMRGEQGKKRLRPRKGIEGAQRNSVVRTDSRVTEGAAPRARTTDFGKGGVAADIFGHRAPRRLTEKWAMQ